MKSLVTNIQPFCVHDGPGIRTTVFLKGCSLHCPWCSNPENILPQQQRCRRGNREIIYGRYMSIEELETEVERDQVFFGKHGGITWSGGEPLMQFPVLEPLLKSLKFRGIHQTAETALFVEQSLLATALKYLDLFIVDIKILDKVKCRKILGGKIHVYMDNVKEIFKRKKRVVFRIPMIKGYTVTEENINLITDFLAEYRPEKLELIKGHNLSEEKYKVLERPFMSVQDIPDAKLEKVSSRFRSLGIRTEICKL